MDAETKPRGRLARRAFRTKLSDMRDKGIVEERTLTGYVCDECDIEDPVGYRVVADYKDQVETSPLVAFFTAGVCVILGIVLGILLLFIVIGIFILLAGLGFGVYFLIQGMRALAQERSVKVEGNIVVHEGELACAICYGSPISVDTTRGHAILRRMRSNSKGNPRD